MLEDANKNYVNYTFQTFNYSLYSFYNFLWNYLNLILQISCGDGAEARERVKEFTFDYSYWSHKESDHHFAPQVFKTSEYILTSKFRRLDIIKH